MPWTRHLWRTLRSPGFSGIGGSATELDAKTLLLTLTYYCALVFLVLASVRGECPYPCDCRWKSGKETVDCKRAGFMIVPEDIDQGTQVLDLSHNNLQVLPKDTFLDVHLVHLQKIYLVDCSLSQIDTEAFRSLSNLIELDISANQMTYVPTSALREVSQLRRLLVTGNPLKSLPAGSFSGLPSLETLELTECDIESIEEGAFDGLSRLTLLKLDSNRLQTLSEAVVAPVVNLNALYLHGNPWRCDCHLKSLRSWMLTRNVPFQVPPKCSRPARLQGRTWKELQLEDYVCEPQVSVESDASEYSEGDNATLTCHVSANPEPSVWWAWQGQPIGSNVSNSANGEPFLVSEEGSEYDKVSRLSIVYTEKSNSGTYACVAENGVSLTTANLTLKVGREEVAEIKLGLVVSHITGIVVGLSLIIVLLIAMLCFFTMRCKHNTPVKGDLKYSDSANHVMNHRDELVHLEEQDLSLLGPNPIQKPPRLGQYHGVPTIDFDHYETVRDNYTPNSVSPHWQTQVVVEFANEEGEEKCLRHEDDVAREELTKLTGRPVSDFEEDKVSKDTSLRPIVEEMNGRESEEGDDSGLELDRGRETELRGFSDQDSDRERLKEKNRRNQEKRTPLCPRDPSAIERELISGSGRERLRRPLVHRGSSGGGGDSTCSSSDPPTVPSSPQRQLYQPAVDKLSSSSLGSPSATPALQKMLRSGRPASLDDEGEDGTEV